MKKNIIYIALLFSSINSIGQIYDPTQGLLGPNSASLGEYGSLPISLYTGTVDVSIPLYKLSSKGIDLPISLSYNTSGVKINTLPSWVGQNWNLNAGGVISRIVQGDYPDEYQYVKRDGINFKSYFQSYNILPTLLNDENLLKETVDPMNKRDLAPDIFIFNFLGKSGKFFLGNDGQWKVQSDWNIDVIFDINKESNFDFPFVTDIPLSYSDPSKPKQAKSIKGFILRDGDGTTYTFGYNENSIEYYIDFFNQTIGDNRAATPSWISNSWYLTEVKDCHSTVLYKLEYTRGYFMAHLYNFSYQTIVKSSGAGGGNQSTPLNSTYPHLSGDLILPTYLAKITDNLNRIEVNIRIANTQEEPYLNLYPKFNFIPFYLTNTFQDHSVSTNVLSVIDPYIYKPTGKIDIAQPLRGIKMKKVEYVSIQHKDGNYKVFEFIYNNGSESKEKRLALTSLHEYDSRFYYSAKPDGLLRTYRFSYNNIDKLPDYLSKEEDHWGYYNGNDYSNGTKSMLEKRASNSTMSLYGTLDTITYPTKGKTIFTYSTHSANLKVALNKQSMEAYSGTIGGARIIEIKDLDSNNKILRQRKFKYLNEDNKTSSGQLAVSPIYDWTWQTSGTSKGAKITLEMSRSTSIVPLVNTFGTYIGYSRIIETVEDQNNQGYIVHAFSNYSNYKDDLAIKSLDSGSPSPFDKFSERNYRRGQLLSLKYYNSSNTLIKSTEYTYRDDNPENTQYSLSSNLTLQYGYETAAHGYYKGKVYKIYYPRFDIVKETNIDYFNSNLLTIKDFEKKDFELVHSDGKTQRKINIRVLLSEQQKNSIGSVYKVEYEYPFQNQETIMQSLTKKYIVDKPFRITKLKGNDVIESKLIKYKSWYMPPAGIKPPTMAPDLIEAFTRIKPSSIETSSGGNLQTEITYDLYDLKGNLLQLTTKDGIVKSYLWSYKGQYPVAEIANATYEDVKTALGDTSPESISALDSPDMSKINVLRDKLPNAHVTTYTYKPLIGMETMTDPKGVATYYDYDSFQRLKEVYIKETPTSPKRVIESYDYKYANQ